MVRFVFAIALIFAVALAPKNAAALDSITISDVGSSAVHWPYYVALAEGYFEENGIKIDLIHAQSSAGGLLQLASGSVDMASGGVPDTLRAIDKGAPITLLRIEQGPAPYQVYAKQDIRVFSDLKGKRVVLGGDKDITRVYFERMSRPMGLTPGSYDMVFAGSSGARLAALVSGSVDATILAPPFSFKAQAEKFSNLPGAPDYAKGIPFVAFVVNTNWARGHHSSIAKFLKAYAKGVDWFNDAANRKKAIDILAKNLSVDSDQAEKTYDVYVSLKAFDRSGAVNQESLEPLIEILKAQGDITGPADLSRFFKQDIIGAPQ